MNCVLPFQRRLIAIQLNFMGATYKELFLKLKSDDPVTLPIFQTSGATSMS